MASKPKIPKRRTQLEIWKSIRKEPTPAGRTHERTNRKIDAANAEVEKIMLDDEGDEVRCVFCGELRFTSDFENGLRCRYCVKNDAALDWENEGGK